MSEPTDFSVATPRSYGPIDIAGFGITVLMVMSYMPQGASPWWTPRIATLLLALPIGLTLLVRLACRGSVSGAIAALIVAWATFVAFMSDAPWVSFVGAIGRHNSVLALAGAGACWAIGRHLSATGRQALGWVVVAGSGASALVALIQLILVPLVSGSPYLALDAGRPTGLGGSPIYFGAHMAACGAWFAHRVSLGGRRLDWLGFATAALSAGLSGSRIALVSVLVIAIWAAIRTRRWHVSMLVPVTILAGYGASVIHSLVGSEQSAGDRVATTEGFSDRFELWSFGLLAWLDRPIMGWGSGRFRAATQGHYTDDWVKRFPSDTVQSWPDAHNYLIENLVAIGFVGVLLLAVLIVTAAFNSSGPLLWMSSAVAIGWMFEPAALPTYSVAALLLGGASTQVVDPAAWNRKWLAIPTAMGVALSAWFLAADASLDSAIESATTDDFDGAAIWFRTDPVAANTVAATHLSLLEQSGRESDVVLAWSQRAVEREPDSVLWWGLLAVRKLRFDDIEGARTAAEHALRLQPNHPVALQVMQIVGQRTGDDALARKYQPQLCAVGIERACEAIDP